MSAAKNKNRMAHLLGQSMNTLVRIAPKLTGRIAFALFCTPRKKSVKPEEAAFLATADLHTEQIAGQDFAVYHWGFKGPIVLLAHGWESHAGRWRKFAPPLVQAGYQVIAVDAPAHGRSSGKRFTMIHYAEVLRALLQRYGPIETIVGHSVGGAASIWAMGTAAPALRPKKAVILAAFAELNTIFTEAQEKVGISEPTMRSLYKQFERLFGHPVSHYSLRRAAKQLDQVKALLIHDRQDHVTGFFNSQQLAEAWPGAQLVATEGLGHGLTAPAAVEMVVDFVLDAVYQ